MGGITRLPRHDELLQVSGSHWQYVHWLPLKVSHDALGLSASAGACSLTSAHQQRACVREHVSKQVWAWQSVRGHAWAHT